MYRASRDASSRENVLPPGVKVASWQDQEPRGRERNAGRMATPTPVGGRKVLGVLHSNQALQPHHKSISTSGFNCNNENSGHLPAGKAPTKPSFTIHEDEPDGAPCRSTSRNAGNAANLTLNSTVLSLGNCKPLASIECAADVSFDSPMVLDMSVSSVEEKRVHANVLPEYADDIHKYLREMELKCRPKAGYMKKQPDITSSMRAILVDWLVEVGEEYKLQNETLYLAVNYIDRFLSSMSVLRGKLQLVGTAAMLLASKFEEIYPPEVAEFVYITDDTYTKKQVLRMEHLILKVLAFDLAAPTINQFLNQYIGREKASSKVESLSMYLAELSLIDCEPFLKYLPSVLAASAFCLANYTISRTSWPRSLAQLTGYVLESLMPCVTDLHQNYLKAPEHAQQAVREKYKSSKYHGVSNIDPPLSLDLLLLKQ
ncbi:cyclin-A2-like [Chiloscyllium plagiosum]|uniref:cyclin-A2-like n=1 Tax=Chiloscyllium plagiosum TaxID=36176 RepID=UPI001CB87802|nr:cyclin-A2-like [Chiloscyllium plagiosum]